MWLLVFGVWLFDLCDFGWLWLLFGVLLVCLLLGVFVGCELGFGCLIVL